MDLCLLCLERNNDELNVIEIKSLEWNSLNITNILETHFWPLETLESNSWMCSSCWERVEDFHNFYLRVEEAHMNFASTKNDESQYLESKEELIPKGDNEQIISTLEVEIVTDPKTLQILQEEGTFIQTIEDIDDDRETIEDYRNVNESVEDIEDVREGIEDPPNINESIEDTENDSETNEDIPNISEIFDPLDESKSNQDENIELNPIEMELMEQDTNDSQFETELEEDSDNNDSVGSLQEQQQDKNCITKYNKIQENDEFIIKHLKKIVCDLCDTALEDFNDMKKHFFTIHNQKGYIQCCNRKYYHRGHLVDHLRCHLNPEYFKCSQCGKILSDRNNFKNHMIRVHRPNDVDYKYSCDMCEKTFAKEFLLRLHKVSHERTEDKEFPCTHCEKFFKNAAFLKRHVDIVHLRKNEKICDICGKPCSTATGYKTHMRKHEFDPVKCGVCGLRLKNQHGLKRHLKVQHPVGGKKPHPCSLCKHVSYSAKSLRNHVYYMHEKGYDYKCTLCEKAFKASKALREHIATHTGDRLYTCNYCPKTYNSYSNLVSHRKKLHAKEWEEEKRKKYY